MEKIKLSFPFFYIFILLFSLLKINVAYSQEKNDSIAFYYDLAISPKKTSDLASAYKFFIDHKDYCLKQNNMDGAVYDLRLLAIIQNESGLYYDSEKTVIEALTLIDKQKINKFRTKSKIGLYNQLGRIYRVLKDYDRALLYYQKALIIADGHLDQQSTIINNKAFIYLDQNELNLALLEFEKAYNFSIKLKDSSRIARNLDNIGFVKSKLNNEDAISNMKKALAIRVNLNDKQGVYASYKHLSEHFKYKENNNKALEYIEKALKIAKEINSESYELDALSAYLDLNTDSKIVEFKRLNDKVSLTNLLTENKYASKKYNYAKKEKEAQNSKRQKEKYQLIGMFLLLLIIFVYLFLISKHKKDKIQQVYITETRIAKKVHDEVANDVFQVITKLQEDSSIKESILDDLDNIYSRTRDISRENSTLDVNEHFEITLNDLFLSYKNDNVNIITRNIPKINWNTIEALKKITLYRVLQELMVNMKKHSQATNVALTFNTFNNKIDIVYTDNGIGCKIKKGTGLLNMENRIESIKGTIIFESEINKGFKAKITV